MTELTDRQAQLLKRLQRELAPEEILGGAAVASRSAGIWRNDSVSAPLIFRPATTAALARVLSACNELRQPVITHGGLTGLAEGAIAAPHDIVLSTEKLDRVVKVDSVNRLLHAQAGVTLQVAHSAAADAGLMLGLDLGARGSCTLGGNAATNAGGHQVIRYGMAREQIVGLEAVLADGTIVSSMRGMLKDNAGYDLKQLFVGTEGTLGVVTELLLRLRPCARTEETALVACPDFDAVAGFLGYLDAALGGALSAFEVLWQDYYTLVAGDSPPLAETYPYYVLVEATGADPGHDGERFASAIAGAADAGQVADGLICKSGAERARIWALRDSVERTLEQGPASIFDVSLPLTQMEAYIEAVKAALAAVWGDAQQAWVFGHAGDGNLHLVVAAGNGDAISRERIAQCVYAPLAAIGGSVSGEHGIGLEKKPWLHISRSPAEIGVMKRLKLALDPHNILNPGRIFDAHTEHASL